MFGVYTQLYAAFSPEVSTEKPDLTKEWGEYLLETRQTLLLSKLANQPFSQSSHGEDLVRSGPISPRRYCRNLTAATGMLSSFGSGTRSKSGITCSG